MKIINSSFTSRGTRCAGELYLPEASAPPPVVIMAHGFAGEMAFRLQAFAERFTERGLAVFLFDYRTFGKSGGLPRQIVSPGRHLADWRSALKHVRSLDTVDTGRIALWGTSFSGGHVLVTAAGDPGIRAVVSQAPFVDGIDTVLQFPPLFVLRATGHALCDLAKLATLGPPHYVPVVEKPENFGLLNTPDSWDGYMSIIPEGHDIKNYCAARIGMTLPLYRPARHAGNIACPVMIVAAEYDSLIRLESVRKTADRIAEVRYHQFPVGHFDIYTGENFEKAAALEGDFLAENLL